MINIQDQAAISNHQIHINYKWLLHYLFIKLVTSTVSIFVHIQQPTTPNSDPNLSHIPTVTAIHAKFTKIIGARKVWDHLTPEWLHLPILHLSHSLHNQTIPTCHCLLHLFSPSHKWCPWSYKVLSDSGCEYWYVDYVQSLKKLSQCFTVSWCLVYNTILRNGITSRKFVW